MLRRTSLVALTVLAAGCTDLSSFETACSEDPSQCEDASTDTFVETSSDETAPPDSASDTVIDDADAEPDTAVDTSLEDVGPETEPDAEPETLADAADSSSDASLDSSSDSGADAKSDASDTGSDASICTANAYSCSGAILRQCNATGTGYTNVVTCPSAATCSPSLKRCTACTPGAYSCTGATRVQCDTYGATTTTVATCATPELCLASTGSTCKAPSCGTSEKRCGAHDLETCNAGRTGWETSKLCVAGCSALACLDVVELVGARGGGGNHFCARISDGTVRCWGENIEGAVDGIGTITAIRKPTVVGGIAGAVQIAASERGSGARFSDGSVREWGRRSDFTSGPPAVVLGLTATAFAMGGYFGCAITPSGAVACYGSNGSSQLGDASTTDRIPPTFSSTGVTGAVGIFAGGEQAIALIKTGTKAWGANGGLAVGSATTPITTPTTSYAGVTQVSVDVGHSCARRSDGTAVCSGDNTQGQLGNGTLTPSTTPVAVSGLTGVVQVVVGAAHSCAVSTDGRVRCWGANDSGQLGNGTKVDSKVPVLVSGISTAIAIAASSVTTCALLVDHMVTCWGSNSYGALGADLDPTTKSESSLPVAVPF